MSSFRGLQPWLRPYADYLMQWFPDLRITSVYRSYTSQYELWINRANNPFPVAPPGCSQHNLGLAWDMVGDTGRLALAGRIWSSWGGDWTPRDPIHFGVGGQPC